MTWRDFWNADTPIYANARHKEVHYRLVADDIVRLLPGAGGRVLDYGCGEALSADRIAARVAHLYLCDAAPLVRERLQARFAGTANISVLAPEELDRVGEGTLALAILNSVLQYLDPAERDEVLAAIRRKLHPGGRLIVADVLPHHLSPLRDARALLGLAAANGFLAAAAGGWCGRTSRPIGGCAPSSGCVTTTSPRCLPSLTTPDFRPTGFPPISGTIRHAWRSRRAAPSRSARRRAHAPETPEDAGVSVVALAAALQ